MLNMFKEFMDDVNFNVMFISGQAGTGKTTSLHMIDEYCYSENINHHITAFTHKAVSVLKSKINRSDAKVSTLHSFLKKKPTINEHATRYDQVVNTESFDKIDMETELLIIDEFSMIEEEEVNGIMELIKDKDFKLRKILLIGDPNQLPPVSGKGLTIPENYKYHYKLTKIWRQSDTNPLINTLTGYVRMIESKSYNMTPEIKELFVPHDHYVKNTDLTSKFIELKKSGKDVIMLAYSNRTVQQTNENIFSIMPVEERWSPTLRDILTPKGQKSVDSVVSVNSPFARGGLVQSDVEDDGRFYPNPEFQTLVQIYNTYEEVKLGVFEMSDGELATFFFVHGHQTFKDFNEKLLNKALAANKAIEEKFDVKPSDWVKMNRYHPLAQERRDAWRLVYGAKHIINIDYPFCITIHKSQGSTWEYVLVNAREMYNMFQGRDSNMMFARLMYVACSRASETVYLD